ncbi:MAG: hypothetical protein GEV06_21575 [Luteitalea sp.]|nr:hypothetical protein [Luteitalea sp.]
MVTFIDWLIVIVYCALLVGVALHFRRVASRGVEDYFLADRKLPWWVIGLSDSASYTGGGQGFLMVFFLGGFAGLWLMAWLSWVIWMPLVAVLWARFWRRLGVVTTGEFIERRYGGRRARLYRNVFAVYACVAWGLTALAYASAWMAATIAPMLGWTNGQVLLVFGGITLFYTLLSGFLAVAYNDVIQFSVLILGNLLFGVMLLSREGGFEAVWQGIETLRGGGFLSPWPQGDELTAISVVALIVQGLFFAGSPYAGEGFTAQRYLAARNERHAVAGQIFNGLLALVIRLIPFILIGLAAAAMFAPEDVAVPAQLWGDLAKNHATAGIFGVLLVAALAGNMAGISSIANWAVSYLMNDLYRVRLRPNADSREYVAVSRVLTAGLLGAAFFLGAAIDPRKLDTWVLFINSALMVFPLPLAWLKWFWWRTNVYADMVGILGAVPAGYLVWFGSDAVVPARLRESIHSLTGVSLDGLVPAFGNLEVYPFWMGFGILFVLGWTSILLATFLGPPEDPKVLDAFYRTVRPIGWWGPVRARLEVGDQQAFREETRRDLRACASGVSFYFSLVVAFFSVMGGWFATAALAAAVALVTGIHFFRSTLGNAETSHN